MNIIEAKKQVANADTNELEDKIDRLVYELYGLTDEEIAIVEGKVQRSEFTLQRVFHTRERNTLKCELRTRNKSFMFNLLNS
ncbi:MAG: hypothetical protein ACR2J3_03560 [Aridibacter sp.]